MDAAYQDFRSAAGGIPENEAMFRARWARDHYNRHAREHREQIGILHEVQDFLEELIAWESLPSE